MLGKTVPEPNSDGRVFVCSAGLSREMGSLLRIYPLARRQAPERWTINRVPLERNPRDSRRESWKLAGDRSVGAHEQINNSFHCVGKVSPGQRTAFLSRCVVPSIAVANERRLSLAVIHPVGVPHLGFDYNQNSPEAPELRLFDDEYYPSVPSAGAKRFTYCPRLEFWDEVGPHSLTLRDWGCFEFMRKHGDGRRHELADALRLDAFCSLLVGNQNHRRTGWLVISVLRGIRPDGVQQALPFEEIE